MSVAVEHFISRSLSELQRSDNIRSFLTVIFGNPRSLSESYHLIGKQREHCPVFLRVAKQCPMKITYQVNSRMGFSTE